jgi:hypothetical protein
MPKMDAIEIIQSHRDFYILAENILDINLDFQLPFEDNIVSILDEFNKNLQCLVERPNIKETCSQFERDRYILFVSILQQMNTDFVQNFLI